MNYEEAKAQGFIYVTRNPLGGECVHKTKPERVGGYWESPGWRYIQGGKACPEKNVIMAINVAIKIQKRQQEALKLATQARKRAEKEEREAEYQRLKEEVQQKAAAEKEAKKLAKEAEKRAREEARAREKVAKKETRKRTRRRFCKTCKMEFDAEHGSISYCSDLCRNIGKRRNNAKWMEKQRDGVPPELGALATCKQCGQKFHRSRQYIAYCSDACREAARVAKRPMHSKTCAVCGTEFTTTDGRRRYCSKKCQSAANSQQKELPTRICKECGEEFKATQGRKYCSAACSYEANRRNCRERKRRNKESKPPAPETKTALPIFIKCKECHRVFRASNRQQVYCSIKCSEDWRKKEASDDESKQWKGVFYR